MVAPRGLSPSPSSASAVRPWAGSALWAGLAWLVLALAPIPFTTLLGLPIALYALVGGWLSARAGQAAGDRVALRRARWGLGLGCAGFVYLFAFYLVAGAALAAGLFAAVRAATNGAP